jgi:hypothetical protein
VSAEERTRGIIVLGVPRSGTTLLRRLLDAHPNIACPGETNLFRACGRFLQSDRVAEGVRVGIIDGLAYAGFAESEVLDRLRSFVFSFHEDNAKRQDKKRWAEKSPLDAFYIDSIEKLCGDSVQYVCIQRHGLDVAISIKDLCEKNGGYLAELHEYVARHPLELEAFAHAWVDVTRSIHALAKRRPRDAVLVSYEDLTAQTDATMSRTMQFLGEEWDPQWTERALANRRHLGLGDWKTYGRKSIDQSSVNRWSKLSRDTINRLAAICNPTLELCGYAPIEIESERSTDEVRRRVEIGLLLQRMKKKPNGGDSKKSPSREGDDDRSTSSAKTSSD